MSGKQVYQAYLLRLWRDDAGVPWRATLVATARPDDHLHFATLDELCAFLMAQSIPATLLTQADTNQSAQWNHDPYTPDGAE